MVPVQLHSSPKIYENEPKLTSAEDTKKIIESQMVVQENMQVIERSKKVYANMQVMEKP